MYTWLRQQGYTMRVRGCKVALFILLLWRDHRETKETRYGLGV
jgi:hypothetical protein